MRIRPEPNGCAKHTGFIVLIMVSFVLFIFNSYVLACLEICYVFICVQLILNRFKSIVIALNPFKNYSRGGPAFFIPFDPNSYFKQVSVKLVIGDYENDNGD